MDQLSRTSEEVHLYTVKRLSRNAEAFFICPGKAAELRICLGGGIVASWGGVEGANA